MSKRDVIIIGSGPSGLTAAIYAARANLKPLCISGYQRGGQLMITTDVENYPGFPEGITGPDMMELFRKQAERFGTEFIDKDVTKVDFSSQPFKITIEEETYEAETVIIATGASAQWIGLESEKRLQGGGVSACATCDGAFFRDKVVSVVGGGDTAMEEASFLTRFASKVYVIHRRDAFRASKIMQERVLKNPKIEVIWNAVVDEVLGEHKVEAVKLKDTQSGEFKEVKCDGLFVAIGHTPNTKVFQGHIELDDHGYIKVHQGIRTNIEGVFAAGDVHDARYRQAITAAGFGCMAALEVEKYLEAKEG